MLEGKIDRVDCFLHSRSHGFREKFMGNESGTRVGFRKGDRGFEIFANEWFSWTGDLSAISYGKGNKSRHVDASDWLWVMARFQSLDTRWTFERESEENHLVSASSCTLDRGTSESTKEEGHRANKVGLYEFVEMLTSVFRKFLQKFQDDVCHEWSESRELKSAKRPEIGVLNKWTLSKRL